MGAVLGLSVQPGTRELCRAMAPQNCSCHLQGWGDPLCATVLPGLRAQGHWWVWGCRRPPSPVPGCSEPQQCHPVPQPRGLPNPLPGPRGSLCHFGVRKGRFGQRRERRRRLVQQFLPGRYKGKTNRKRVRVRVRAHPVSVPMSMAISMPTLLPGLVWRRAMPRGRPPSPSRAGSPWAPQPRAGSVPSRLSPGSPRSPLAAGIGAMAFQLEERWRWQRVLGATSCRLSALPVSPWWLRRGPSPPGCPIPDGWVAPRRWHRPHGPTGSSGVPRATGGARQESPAAGAGSGRGEAAWRGSVGAVTCHRAPGYPETCRSTRLKQASMRGRRAGGEGHPIHREKVPQRQGWGGWRRHAARGRGE